MKDPVEENLLVYFRKPEPGETCVKWMPAASHTQQDSHLRKDTGEQAGDTDIGDCRSRNTGSGQEGTAQGSTEYEVVDLQNDEVNNGFGKRTGMKRTGKTIRKREYCRFKFRILSIYQLTREQGE